MKLTANPVGWRCECPPNTRVLTDCKIMVEDLERAGWTISPVYADLDNDPAGIELEKVLTIAQAFKDENEVMETNAMEFVAGEIFEAYVAFVDDPTTPEDFQISSMSDYIAKRLLNKLAILKMLPDGEKPGENTEAANAR